MKEDEVEETIEKPKVLCRKCKFRNSFLDECRHPKSFKGYDYITGKERYELCNTMRKLSICGTKGKLFEPKSTIFNRIKNIMNK